MKKLLLFVILVAGVMSMCISCEKDEYGYPPEYGKIILEPASPVAGDSVTATVQVLKAGNGIYRGDFEWTLDGRKYEQEGVLDPLEKDISFRFLAEEGSHVINCRAKRFYMSKKLESGQLYSSASAQETRFTVKGK